MQNVTIGTKNQIVIPKEVRRKVAGLQPGNVISVYAQDKDTIIIKASRKSWLERSYGAFKVVKSSVSQIETMRNEWNDK